MVNQPAAEGPIGLPAVRSRQKPLRKSQHDRRAPLRIGPNFTRVLETSLERHARQTKKEKDKVKQSSEIERVVTSEVTSHSSMASFKARTSAARPSALAVTRDVSTPRYPANL